MSEDIHNFDRTIRLYLSKTDDPDIHEFAKALQMANYSGARVARYLITLVELEEFIGKRLRNATKEDLQKFVLSLKDKKAWTKDTVLRQVKVFYRWLASGALDRGAPYPEIVSWIKAGVKKNELEEPEILTEDEVKALIDKAPMTRDKALIGRINAYVKDNTRAFDHCFPLKSEFRSGLEQEDGSNTGGACHVWLSYGGALKLIVCARG